MTNYGSTAYLDNAATSPTPPEVIKALEQYYEQQKVNVHRGMYQLSAQVTQQYESVRVQVAHFIKAASEQEIIFTAGATAALNLVAFGYGLSHLQAGDEILVSVLEHHSNLVPWQQLARLTGAKLRFIGINVAGNLDQAQLFSLLNSHTKIVSLTLLSNVLGNYLEIAKIAPRVHAVGAILVVDAAQAVAHLPIAVQQLQADFLAFSGHKMFGPTGVGVLYGRAALLRQMQPTSFGGEMIEQVNYQGATFLPAPQKFEAGTPNIAGVLGLGAAISYLEQIGFAKIKQQEQLLMQQLLTGLLEIGGIQVYGSQRPEDHIGVVSFNLDTIHAHDVATILDTFGVAVRAGHQCAQPLMRTLGVESVVRASLAFTNQKQDIQRLLQAILAVKEILS
ncbi:aminotransferase class V-fold PLP-dependent enzyme [Bombilactobacillus bombi]|uniref:aminotransferase class V-fold PLP-dependent enzyme n=1 Tax=Bombilactobacillus bombi TaxID=1303590 RepID=UPI0015E5B453|nr:SufS family cysteine desulfurase [Bombilactobacillus bombi]MBA1434020.1 SufS family cysteine desulfurase [Bombilactobacillus bombi]